MSSSNVAAICWPRAKATTAPRKAAQAIRRIAAYHWLHRVERAPDPANGRLDELERRNFDFHEALVSACDRRWTLHLRGIVFRQHERYRRLSRIHSAKTRQVSDEHRALFDAALERNEEAVVAVITSHIRRTSKAVSEALRKPQGDEGNA